MSKTFGHGTERVSRRSPPETAEVQPSSDDILKQEEKAKLLQRRQSECIRWPHVRYGTDEYGDAGVDSIQHNAYSACQIVEPQRIEEALEGDCSVEWKQATNAEYASLMSNDTWELVELPSGRQAIRSKWVFQIVWKWWEGGMIQSSASCQGLISETWDWLQLNTLTSCDVSINQSAILAFALQNDLLLHHMDVQGRIQDSRNEGAHLSTKVRIRKLMIFKTHLNNVRSNERL